MKQLRLLIVDDESTIRLALTRWFEASGFKVHAVASGAEAVQCCRDGQFALILLDVEMPRMCGMETLNAIRQIDRETPVIILTGNPEAARGAELLGACRVLAKPLRLSELEQHVHACLSLRESA